MKLVVLRLFEVVGSASKEPFRLYEVGVGVFTSTVEFVAHLLCDRGTGDLNLVPTPKVGLLRPKVDGRF